MGYNQKYKEYKREGGTKSFKDFAEMENSLRLSSNEFYNQDSVLESIFEQPKTQEEFLKDNIDSQKITNIDNKVFGINKNLFYLSSALIVIAIASVVYKKYVKK